MSEFETATTQELVDQMVASGKRPHTPLLKAILARGAEAVAPLRELLREQRAGSFETSTIDMCLLLLGSLRDASAIPELFELLRTLPVDDLDLLENALGALGAGVVEPALDVLADSTLENYRRLTALTAARQGAGDDLPARARIAEVGRAALVDELAKVDQDDDTLDMIGFLVCELAEMADPLARDLITRAFDEDRVEPFIVDRGTIDNLYREGGRNAVAHPDWWVDRFEKEDRRPHDHPPRYLAPRPLVELPSPPRIPLAQVETIRNTKLRPGRNDPCWCGSGKKYKTCHLREDQA